MYMHVMFLPSKSTRNFYSEFVNDNVTHEAGDNAKNMFTYSIAQSVNNNSMIKHIVHQNVHWKGGFWIEKSVLKEN